MLSRAAFVRPGRLVPGLRGQRCPFPLPARRFRVVRILGKAAGSHNVGTLADRVGGPDATPHSWALALGPVSTPAHENKMPLRGIVRPQNERISCSCARLAIV
eukprot:1586194-Pleurochrysis_carterae.AAC.3